MLKKRIITTLLFDGAFLCVKPVAFARPYRILGNLKQYVNVIERRSIDELVLIDIMATSQKRDPQFERIKSVLSNVFCPITVGGGIRGTDDVTRLLQSGADKVVIKTGAVGTNLIYEASRKFGSQAIVIAMDWLDSFEYLVATAKMYEEEGAGEIMLTDMDKDGTMEGYNLDLIEAVSDAVNIPVIASGGCGQPDDMIAAFAMGADAVAAGSLFLYTDWTPRKCAEYLDENGIEVRL